MCGSIAPECKNRTNGWRVKRDETESANSRLESLHPIRAEELFRAALMRRADGRLCLAQLQAGVARVAVYNGRFPNTQFCGLTRNGIDDLVYGALPPR